MAGGGRVSSLKVFLSVFFVDPRIGPGRAPNGDDLAFFCVAVPDRCALDAPSLDAVQGDEVSLAHK